MENTKKEKKEYTKDSLHDGIITTGFLEVLPDGFGLQIIYQILMMSMSLNHKFINLN